MEKFPELKTKRLLLNQLSAVDIPLIVEYAGNPKIAATTLNIPHPYDEKAALSWISTVYQGFDKKTQYTFAIRLPSENTFIGAIGLILHTRFERAELGYWIAEPFWGQGYASEAAQEVVRFGFKVLNLHKIEANHFKENPASGKVMMKIGMTCEGTLRDHVKKGDKYKTIIQYGILSQDFKAHTGW